MRVADFDFHLPEDLIAQEPLAERSASRMLHLRRDTGAFADGRFADFSGLLRPDDLVVVNNTRVFPARLFGHRAGVHAQPLSARNPAAKDFLRGRIEVLLTRQLGPFDWEALVRPGRKIGVGEKIWFGDRRDLEAEIIGRGEFGERTLRFSPVPDFFVLVEKLGHVPLPPYIARQDRGEDRERYQTVYAKPEARGSVAAPTAGLHFTPAVLQQIRERGIEIAEITLHVGLGTFQPVHAENVEEHKMHSESFHIEEAVAEQINRALAERRRIVAVGTTTVRTLEYAASLNEASPHLDPATRRSLVTQVGVREARLARIQAGSGEADLFIYPGFKFRVVGALLTNFHLPQSTLLMLVSAFAGREHVLHAYDHAVKERYRFFSYGDCMFIE